MLSGPISGVYEFKYYDLVRLRDFGGPISEVYDLLSKKHHNLVTRMD
jgi:hypothetical protein